MNTQHPSFLLLDRCALGAPLDPDTRNHLAHCADCQAHLQRVGALPESGALPSWLGELAAQPGPRRSRRSLVFSSMLAAAAALVIVWRFALPEPPAFDTVKGLPAVAVYVERNGRVSLWTGEVLSAGDRIRLEVSADDRVHAAVFLRAGDSQELLYQGRLATHARTLLPRAWQLDDSGAEEHLSVVLSDAPITPARAELLLRAADADLAHAYVIELILPKRR